MTEQGGNEGSLNPGKVGGDRTEDFEARGSDSLPPTTEESVTRKLNDYLLNLDHPVGGLKAKWFRSALGFIRNNADKLAKQIVFDLWHASNLVDSF